MNEGDEAGIGFLWLMQRLDDVIERNPNVSTADNRINLHHLLVPSTAGNATGHSHGSSALSSGRILAISIAYLVIFVLSLVGNSIVCQVIYRNKRLHTVTNTFIANLALSDLFITLFNLPLHIVRHLAEDWPLGQFMCRLVNLTQTVFVYVSTFTMTIIAVDRYMVIIHPFRPRMSISIGLVVVAVIWIMAAVMSSPFAFFAQVREVELFKRSTFRCSVVYPEPSDSFERRLTLATFVGQYVLPMVITSGAYGCVSYRLWLRRTLGQATCRQRLNHDRTRRRTIAMLIVVVAIFNATWLPLNLYHLLTDFHPNSTSFYYNSTVYLCLHWLAISSVCCNPFVYCWLNDSFRGILCNGGRCAARLTRRPAILRPLAGATDPDRRCNRYDPLGCENWRPQRQMGVGQGRRFLCAGVAPRSENKLTSRLSAVSHRRWIPEQSPPKRQTIEISTICLHLPTVGVEDFDRLELHKHQHDDSCLGRAISYC